MSRYLPLKGLLVVDLTRYLPGPFASRELLRRGARVVRLESPEGDPLQQFAPEWHRALNTGKESVVCDLRNDKDFGRALCSQADVVLEGFRPGVAQALGVGPAHLPPTVVYCSISGFGATGSRSGQVGHDLNYLGYAGVLAETAPHNPPLPIADLAAGSLAALNEILLALYDRQRTGLGQHITLSMTHMAHHLVSHGVSKEKFPGLLTGSYACYRVYETADERFLTVGALEARFFSRLCEILDCSHYVDLQYDATAQPRLIEVFRSVFLRHSLQHWLDLFSKEEVAIGPVHTLAEAGEEFGMPAPPHSTPELGEHTEQWRATLRRRLPAV